MRIKPRAIAAVLCMIFFVGFTVCGVVRSTDQAILSGSCGGRASDYGGSSDGIS